jgi:hypothetical protein
MTKAKTLVVSTIGAYLATLAIVGHADSASAAERRIHSTICHYTSDDTGSSVYNGAYLQISSTYRQIYCPVVSDSTLSHASATYLNVHGSNPSSATQTSFSRACVKDAWTMTSTCGTNANWSITNGLVAQSVSTSVWASHSDWFPYVFHFMYPGTYLYGMWMSS